MVAVLGAVTGLVAKLAVAKSLAIRVKLTGVACLAELGVVVFGLVAAVAAIIICAFAVERGVAFAATVVAIDSTAHYGVLVGTVVVVPALAVFEAAPVAVAIAVVTGGGIGIIIASTAIVAVIAVATTARIETFSGGDFALAVAGTLGVVIAAVVATGRGAECQQEAGQPQGGKQNGQRKILLVVRR